RRLQLRSTLFPYTTLFRSYAEDITGDLGATLWRFPQLRSFIYDDNEDPLPAEATWIRLCTWIRAMPKLDQIELGGGQLTDASISDRKNTRLNSSHVEISYA